MAVEYANEQFIDHFLVVRHVGNELSDGIVLGTDRIAHSRTTDKRHDRAKLKFV